MSRITQRALFDTLAEEVCAPVPGAERVSLSLRAESSNSCAVRSRPLRMIRIRPRKPRNSSAKRSVSEFTGTADDVPAGALETPVARMILVSKDRTDAIGLNFPVSTLRKKSGCISRAR